jgi:hypothetical protein
MVTKSIFGATCACLAVVSYCADAELVGRLAATPGGTDYKAYYDDVANLTWLADANYAMTSGYDADGAMNWAAANAWAAGLSVGGVTGWRLPDTNPVNGTTYNYTFAHDGSTDFGYNISAPGTVYAGSTGSELAYMFYNVLGNEGLHDTSGKPTGCTDPNTCRLTNTGPFSNLQSDSYWSATQFAHYTNLAMCFFMYYGMQCDAVKTNEHYAWAVRSGDVSVAAPKPPSGVRALPLGR